MREILLTFNLFICFQVSCQSLITYEMRNESEGRNYTESVFILKDYSISYLKSTSVDDDVVTTIKQIEDLDISSHKSFKSSKDLTEFPKECGLDFNTLRDNKKNVIYRFKPDYENYGKNNLSLLLIRDSIENLHWDLLEEFDTINNLRCQHAVINFRCQEYDAWICMEIAIHSGPHIFNGAPGLIVKLSRKDDGVSWVLKKFSPSVSFEELKINKSFLEIAKCNPKSFCDLKKGFEAFMKKLKAYFGEEDCLTCESKLTNIKIDECFDGCP